MRGATEGAGGGLESTAAAEPLGAGLGLAGEALSPARATRSTVSATRRYSSDAASPCGTVARRRTAAPCFLKMRTR